MVQLLQDTVECPVLKELAYCEAQIEKNLYVVGEYLQRINEKRLWNYPGSLYEDFTHYCKVKMGTSDPYRQIRAMNTAKSLGLSHVEASEATESHLIAISSSGLEEKESQLLWSLLTREKKVTEKLIRTAADAVEAVTTDATVEIQDIPDLDTLLWLGKKRELPSEVTALIEAHNLQTKVTDSTYLSMLLALHTAFPSEFNDLRYSGYIQLPDYALAIDLVSSVDIGNFIKYLRRESIRVNLEKKDVGGLELDLVPKVAIMKSNSSDYKQLFSVGIHITSPELDLERLEYMVGQYLEQNWQHALK